MSEYFQGSIDDICRELGKTYEELLKELRGNGHGINFDVSQVPADKYDPHVLAGFELTCTIQMMGESFRAALCLHESAHAQYNERISPNACCTIGGPYAFVNTEGELRYANAHTWDSTKGEDEQFDMEDLDFVKSVLAAGIAEEVLLQHPTEGTGLDEALLEATFDQHNVPLERRKHLREQARNEIIKDLRSPAFRKALWARARFFQRILERNLWAAPIQEAVAA
jgi:hypothetical protein